MGEFRTLCAKEKMHELKWPLRDYIVQIARFDPAKGIPNVIDSYVKFRKMLEADDVDHDEDDEDLWGFNEEVSLIQKDERTPL